MFTVTSRMNILSFHQTRQNGMIRCAHEVPNEMISEGGNLSAAALTLLFLEQIAPASKEMEA